MITSLAQPGVLSGLHCLNISLTFSLQRVRVQSACLTDAVAACTDRFPPVAGHSARFAASDTAMTCNRCTYLFGVAVLLAVLTGTPAAGGLHTKGVLHAAVRCNF
jgi:hypothetical protein